MHMAIQGLAYLDFTSAPWFCVIHLTQVRNEVQSGEVICPEQHGLRIGTGAPGWFS